MNIKLEIYLDHLNKANGLLYLDDGDTFKYDSDNEYSLIEYTFEDDTLSYTI